MITDTAADPIFAALAGGDQEEWWLSFPEPGVRWPARLTPRLASLLVEAESDRLCELPPFAPFVILRGDEEMFASGLSRSSTTQLRPGDTISVTLRLKSV